MRQVSGKQCSATEKRRLFGGVLAGLVAAGVLAGGVPAAAQECPPDLSICQDPTELENFTWVFVSGFQVNVAEPDQRTEAAIAAFTSEIVGALASREQAIIAELNAMRVAEAAVAVQGVVQRRNSLQDPDSQVRREFVFAAGEAAYRAESLLAVSSDPEASDQLGQLGMAAYALYVTGTVASTTDLPQPDADEELVLVLQEYLRFLRLLLDILLGGETAEAASDVQEGIEQAIRDILERDPGEGGGSQVLEYVALGDSYASGSGIGDRWAQPGTPTDCHRSLLTYSNLLAGYRTHQGQQLRPVNVACHGAVSNDFLFTQQGVRGIEGPQAMHLSRETTGLVTVSMGGNDLRFPQIVRACLINLAGFCGVGQGNPLASPEDLAFVQGQLNALYTNILARIRPDGQLVILTYPNPTPSSFPNDDPCWVTDKLISQAELAMIAELALDLRFMITAAAAPLVAANPTRVHVVDMSTAFEGHEVCTNDSWANSLTLPAYDSFHPNAAGHRAYRDHIAAELNLISF